MPNSRKSTNKKDKRREIPIKKPKKKVPLTRGYSNNFFELIGCTVNSSQKDIQYGLKKMMAFSHPDKYCQFPAKEKRFMKKVNDFVTQMIAILEDETSRHQYSYIMDLVEPHSGPFDTNFDLIKEMMMKVAV